MCSSSSVRRQDSTIHDLSSFRGKIQDKLRNLLCFHKCVVVRICQPVSHYRRPKTSALETHTSLLHHSHAIHIQPTLHKILRNIRPHGSRSDGITSNTLITVIGTHILRQANDSMLTDRVRSSYTGNISKLSNLVLPDS